jgi:hypothetical protein
MLSSLFGCGVVCGLVVRAEVKCGKLYVIVDRGLALDCQGDPIHVPQPQSVVVDERCDPNIDSPLWVVLCGTVKCCAPRPSECGSDEDETPSVCTRERDGFEIRIVRRRLKCVCACPEPDRDDYARERWDTRCKCVNPELECYVDHYAGKCGCDCDDCSNCDCDCVLLARLDKSGEAEYPVWTADHRVRRFIRPVLMRDPEVEREEQWREKPKEQKSQHQQEQETTQAGGKAAAKTQAKKKR